MDPICLGPEFGIRQMGLGLIRGFRLDVRELDRLTLSLPSLGAMFFVQWYEYFVIPQFLLLNYIWLLNIWCLLMYILIRIFYKFNHVFLMIKEEYFMVSIRYHVLQNWKVFLNITLATLFSPIIKCSRVLLVQPSQKLFKGK